MVLDLKRLLLKNILCFLHFNYDFQLYQVPQKPYPRVLMEPKSSPLQDVRHMLTWSVQTYTVGNLHVIIPISVCLVFSTK